MTAAVGVLREIKPEFLEIIALDPAGLLRGQIWRLFTFLIIPPPTGLLWLLLWMAMQYSILHALEMAWGEFKLTLFIAIGALMTSLGAVICGVEFGNAVVVLSSFLAYARLEPEREVLVLFILPVKLRWLATLVALWAGLQFITGSPAERTQLAMGLAPYALFFGSGHLRDAQFAWRRWRSGLP